MAASVGADHGGEQVPAERAAVDAAPQRQAGRRPPLGRCQGALVFGVFLSGASLCPKADSLFYAGGHSPVAGLHNPPQLCQHKALNQNRAEAANQTSYRSISRSPLSKAAILPDSLMRHLLHFVLQLFSVRPTLLQLCLECRFQ